ncbi:MAG: hypothetical protein K2X47_05975 [Bdellovibrionales bacterium]|nr:hypothetical protein [Bdellovibrionales bacterium]
MKNPVNFLLLITLLFWIPQLLSFRHELKENNDLHKLYMGTDPNIAPKPSAKNIVAGIANPIQEQEGCLMNWIRLYQGSEATPANLIFEKTRFAEKFSVGPQESKVTINSDRIQLLSPPNADHLQWKTTPLPELPTPFFLKSDQIPEALESRIRATKPLLMEEACVPYGQAITASGFVNGQMEMNYTVSVPFTVFLGPIEAARAQMGVQVSRTYVMTALLSMLISFVGLLFFLNVMLRNRINLEMQPIAENLSPGRDSLVEMRKTDGTFRNAASDYLQKIHPQARDFSFAQFGSLPSFYRYHWDDGLDLRGRKAMLAITGTGIVIVELDSHQAAKGLREIAWNDLFCVFFTNWGKQDTWVDLITREGERYQIAFKDIGNLRALLKRWDASEINVQKLAS